MDAGRWSIISIDPVAALDEENEEGDKGEESEEVEEGDEDQVIKVKEVEIAKKVTVCLWRCFFFPLKGGWGVGLFPFFFISPTNTNGCERGRNSQRESLMFDLPPLWKVQWHYI